MGIFSKKSSSTTLATNTSLGFSEVQGDAVAINGTGNTYTTTDHGAVSGAFDFAGQVAEQQTSLAREVIGSTTAAARQYGQQLEAFATKAVADQGDQLAEAMKWMIGGAVLLAGVAFMRKGRA